MNIPYSSLNDLSEWASTVMARKPDFVIGDDYLRRWWVIPRNRVFNIYLHEILHSDDDRALHDHPWENTSFVVAGRYIEHTPEGSFERNAGDIITRKGTSLHRLEILPGEKAISLFQTGPISREWGFACPQGWVHWKEFTNPLDTGKVGRGCGEHS
jgi:hypothetical protein